MRSAVQHAPLALLLAATLTVTSASTSAAGLTSVELQPSSTVLGNKVHPSLLAGARSQPVEFMVVLEEQAVLGPATRKAGRVATTLQETARRTQQPLLDILNDADAEYRPYWVANMIWVRALPGLAERLASRDDVRRIDANPRIRTRTPKPTTHVGKVGKGSNAVEWNISQVQADAVWGLGYTGQGIVIAGQDTGYDWDHEALVGAYRGWDGLRASHDYNWHDAIHESQGPCPGDSAAPCDDHGHGTHTMGTMAGDDGGVNRIGMAPDAQWIGCRNMDQGNGTPATYSECFEWFIAPTDANGANPDPSKAPDVINNSWLCPPSEGCSADTLRMVVENVRAAGIVVVVSAGNSGSLCGTISSPPAIYDAAFTVGATNADDVAAGFSSRGPVGVDGSDRLKPDVAAPGVNIRSSVLSDGYAAFSGTSMAGPHVAGMVALLLSARPDLKGDVATIEELIASSTDPLTTTESCGGDQGDTVPNHTFGHGRIDALAVLEGDADDDGVTNLEDCSPLAAEVWSAPGAIASLRLDRNAATQSSLLIWSDPAQPGGVAIGFNVLRSLQVESFAEATCVSDPGGAKSLAVTDPQTPGDLFAYLVRLTNPCGSTLGPATSTPRQAPDCP